MTSSRFRVVVGAVLAAMAFAAPAEAGEWQYDPATDLIYDGGVPVSRWYGERPGMGQGERHAARPVPRCPHSYCGYPLPIYKTRHPLPALPTYPVDSGWCKTKYKSYDWRTDRYVVRQGEWRRCRVAWR